MDAALIGLAGIVIGTSLGGTGKYFTQRRDAWREARTSGLLLLADVCALGKAKPGDRVVVSTALGSRSWKTHRSALARFRRGAFPSGFKAPQWLELAGYFGTLEDLYAAHHLDSDAAWWTSAQKELDEIERLLANFAKDPPVLTYVLLAPLRRVVGTREAGPLPGTPHT